MKLYPNELIKSIKFELNKFKLFESNSLNCIKKQKNYEEFKNIFNYDITQHLINQSIN